MALFFFDTSVLLKLYVEEPGAENAVRLASRRDFRMALATLGELEFRAALRARLRRGDASPAEVESALAHFLVMAARGALRQSLTDAVLQMAAALLDRYPLRAPDAVQLASCVAVHLNLPGEALYFACSDRVLLQSAAEEGIPAWDPTGADPAPGLH